MAKLWIAVACHRFQKAKASFRTPKNTFILDNSVNNLNLTKPPYNLSNWHATVEKGIFSAPKGLFI
jgi:hypothetical protein